MVVCNMEESSVKWNNFFLWKKKSEFVMTDNIPTDLQQEQHCVELST